MHGTVRLWDAASGESLAVLEGHQGSVSFVALGRIGGRDVAISGGYDRTVRLWDAASGESIAVLEGPNDWVSSVAPGRIGGRDVGLSGSYDVTVRLWNIGDVLSSVETSLPRQLVLGPGPDTFMELVPDGAGGYRIARSSPDAWRYFIAKGWTAEGCIVMAPIEEMMEPAALAAASAAAEA